MKGEYTTQNDLLLKNLLSFYRVEDDQGEMIADNNLDKMLKIITGESKISLRIVDWFVTNYAKTYYVLYYLEGKQRFKVYEDYKLKLKGYSKKKFDPFCRWERISIPYTSGNFIETTIGQLKFFKWAIENKVIDYIASHFAEIDEDMNKRNGSKKLGIKIDNKSRTRKIRTELSLSAVRSLKREEVDIVVQFH